jgi:hypothetical protein
MVLWRARANYFYTLFISLVQSIKQLMLEDYVRVGRHSEITWREILTETKVHCARDDLQFAPSHNYSPKSYRLCDVINHYSSIDWLFL